MTYFQDGKNLAESTPGTPEIKHLSRHFKSTVFHMLKELKKNCKIIKEKTIAQQIEKSTRNKHQ